MLLTDYIFLSPLFKYQCLSLPYVYFWLSIYACITKLYMHVYKCIIDLRICNIYINSIILFIHLLVFYYSWTFLPLWILATAYQFSWKKKKNSGYFWLELSWIYKSICSKWTSLSAKFLSTFLIFLPFLKGMFSRLTFTWLLLIYRMLLTFLQWLYIQ